MASLASARALDRLHRFGVLVVLVIMAQKMQQAMDHEMRNMVLQRLAFQFRLALQPSRRPARCRRASAESLSADFGRKGRKGQHVGRLVLAAPFGVQLLDMGVVGKDDAELRSALACHMRLGKARCGPPLRPGLEASASAGQAPASTRTSIVDLGRVVWRPSSRTAQRQRPSRQSSPTPRPRAILASRS